MFSRYTSFGSSSTINSSFSNIDTMIRRTNALLICAVFLCGLEETVLSQHGHCAGNQCFVLFQEPEDFPGAKQSCKKSNGQLFVFSLSDIETVLRIQPSGLSGHFWLELPSTGTTEEESTGLQNCSSISVSPGRSNFTVLFAPCRDNLNGFLCQYTIEEPCSGLQAGAGAQVKYTTLHMGFEVKDSETFPPGTIAVAEKAGAEYPESKHVCFSSSWMTAPWSCEVLQGGCEHSCNRTPTHTCGCPAGQDLLPNKITCGKHPCAKCAQGCQKEGDTHVCKCKKGYRLARDGRSCEDVNECEEETPCTGEGLECENTEGGFECRCKDGFEEEDGVCVDVSICEKCEHMDCAKVRGVYECLCRKGFKVSAKDPTKCDLDCTERDCKARCIPNSDEQKRDMLQCFCPDGYIIDITNTTAICSDIDECESKPCDHKCENSFGSYRCLCDEGFKLSEQGECIEEEEEDGSGTSPLYPTPASAHPAIVPSYIKTGSVLGITVFLVLCAVLLLCVVQNVLKRCGKFELSSLKHQNIDIFYLQQVTTETYKRLSFDKPLKNDSQIL